MQKKRTLIFYFVVICVRAVWGREHLAHFIRASLRSPCRWRPAGCRCPFGPEHPNTCGAALTGSDLCYGLQICTLILYTQQVCPFCSPHLCISSSPSLHPFQFVSVTPAGVNPLGSLPPPSHPPPSRSLKSHQHVLLLFFSSVFFPSSVRFQASSETRSLTLLPPTVRVTQPCWHLPWRNQMVGVKEQRCLFFFLRVMMMNWGD